MPKKSTPTKPQKPRKIAAGPERWPYEYEDINHMWARDAISMATAQYSPDTFGKRMKSIQEFVAN